MTATYNIQCFDFPNKRFVNSWICIMERYTIFHILFAQHVFLVVYCVFPSILTKTNLQNQITSLSCKQKHFVYNLMCHILYLKVSMEECKHNKLICLQSTLHFISLNKTLKLANLFLRHDICNQQIYEYNVF